MLAEGNVTTQSTLNLQLANVLIGKTAQLQHVGYGFFTSTTSSNDENCRNHSKEIVWTPQTHSSTESCQIYPGVTIGVV